MIDMYTIICILYSYMDLHALIARRRIKWVHAKHFYNEKFHVAFQARGRIQDFHLGGGGGGGAKDVRARISRAKSGIQPWSRARLRWADALSCYLSLFFILSILI